jgi:MATE family multidrug resistance protein
MAKSATPLTLSGRTAGQAALRRILSIALPMVASQASETVMLFGDRFFLSRVSKLHFASAMTGGLTTFSIASLFAGVTGYVNALVAQYYGASREDECAKATVQSIYLSFMAVPFLVLAAILIPRFFSIMGHDPAQVPLESAYARWLLSGSVLLLMRNGLTGFFLGIGRTRVVMIANLAAMVVNVPLNYILIFGKFGLPELGIVGAAIGTIGGSFTAFVILLAAYLSRRVDDRYATRSTWRFDPVMFRRLLRFGAPAGVEIFLNISAFNVFVQLMHSYGANVAAATTITFNWDIVAFIPMLGLAAATTSVVGQHVGASDPAGARRATLIALRLAFVYSGSMALLFLIGARPLVNVFSSGFSDAGAVSELARRMLRLVGLYTIADSTQLVFSGALRGAGDTRWVMRVSVALHWVLAAMAVLLIRLLATPPLLMWAFFIGFLITLGVIMTLRFSGGKWMSMRVI